MRSIFLSFSLLLAAAPVLAGQATAKFNTADGCAIEAWYLAPSSGSPVFINTHGLGSGKYEWGPLQDELRRRGWGYLTLDLRGHGVSPACSGKKTDYRRFTAQDWQNASRDIEAAALWLSKKKIPASGLVFCGASIGANLSLKAAAEGKIKPGALVLLSPGLEYATVRTEPFLAPGLPPLFIAAAPDDPYAWQSSQRLAAVAAGLGLRTTFAQGRSGHGANMLAGPGLLGRALDWVSGK